MKLSNVEKTFGYTFKSPELLERALTHRSWAHENLPGESEENVRAAENESFEFVGDSVLGLVVAEELFSKNPTLSEGDLSLMKHRLVSTSTLAKIAAMLKIGEAIRMSRGEEKTGGRKKSAILADTLEAVIAAVFFDSGYAGARAFVTRILEDELRLATPQSSLDYKTLLQETLQSRKQSAPTYSIVRTEGQPHERTFFVEASWDAGKAHGTGPSIKSAEMMAASEALKALEGQKAANPERSS